MRIDTLPEHLRPLFWDHDFARLAWPADRDLVIARILQEGDDRANVWLYRELGSTELATWIRDRHGRGLDPRRLRFWQVILKLPEPEVERWLRDARATPGKVK